eukprot:Sspe_Gene.115045::Locus_101849_Transcript_1_1_Confidence_1.000_Length_2593::g.115045::m.115045
MGAYTRARTMEEGVPTRPAQRCRKHAFVLPVQPLRGTSACPQYLPSRSPAPSVSTPSPCERTGGSGLPAFCWTASVYSPIKASDVDEVVLGASSDDYCILYNAILTDLEHQVRETLFSTEGCYASTAMIPPGQSLRIVPSAKLPIAPDVPNVRTDHLGHFVAVLDGGALCECVGTSFEYDIIFYAPPHVRGVTVPATFQGVVSFLRDGQWMELTKLEDSRLGSNVTFVTSEIEAGVMSTTAGLGTVRGAGVQDYTREFKENAMVLVSFDPTEVEMANATDKTMVMVLGGNQTAWLCRDQDVATIYRPPPSGPANLKVKAWSMSTAMIPDVVLNGCPLMRDAAGYDTVAAIPMVDNGVTCEGSGRVMQMSVSNVSGGWDMLSSSPCELSDGSGCNGLVYQLAYQTTCGTVRARRYNRQTNGAVWSWDGTKKFRVRELLEDVHDARDYFDVILVPVSETVWANITLEGLRPSLQRRWWYG